MCACCRFVRREKEIAVAQCEASDGEALRYKQRVEHQDRELKELQEALNSEREKMQVRRDGRLVWITKYREFWGLLVSLPVNDGNNFLLSSLFHCT